MKNRPCGDKCIVKTYDGSNWQDNCYTKIQCNICRYNKKYCTKCGKVSK